MRRRMIVIASLVVVAAVALALAISPALYREQTPVSATSTTTTTLLSDQCRKADLNATYPLILQIWNPFGEPVKGAWIILYDEDNGIPFEEAYSSDNGTYRSKHTYSPSQNMTLLIQNDQNLQNYAVNIVIPDVVCADGYIHVEVRAS